jgi:pimeloyl-ACP methyl ester carboxylesterase
MPERISIGSLSALVVGPMVETGPPLLFVHGFFGRAIAFVPMMEALERAGHKCVAIDLRGHGDSRLSQPLGSVSMNDYADDVETAARGLDNPIIVGHSMGGMLAQMVGARGVGCGLVLLSPAPPRGIPLMSIKLAIAQSRYMPAILTSRTVIPGRADLRALVVNKIPGAEQDMILDMLVPDSGRAAREMSMLGVPVDRDRVTVPMLVIGGEDDRFIPWRRYARVAKRYAAPFLLAPGRGHMLILEPKYEEICRWISDWIVEHFPTHK